MSVTEILPFRIVRFKIIWPSGKRGKYIQPTELVEWNSTIALFPVNERVKLLMERNLETLLSFIPKVKDLSFFEKRPWSLPLLKEDPTLFLKSLMEVMSTSTMTQPFTAVKEACCCLKMQRILFTPKKERAFVGSMSRF